MPTDRIGLTSTRTPRMGGSHIAGVGIRASRIVRTPGSNRAVHITGDPTVRVGGRNGDAYALIVM
jgi:hypothetical protein